jgi:hypothetical protein
MTKKVLAIAYNKVPIFSPLDLDIEEAELLIGSLVEFRTKSDLDKKNGFIEINHDELSVNKYKKLANVLINQRLLKSNAKSFRLDEVFGLAKKTVKKKKK